MSTVPDGSDIASPPQPLMPMATEVDISGSAQPSAGAVPFAERFHKGIAISMWQNSGGENTNWSDFAERSAPCCNVCGMWPTIMDRKSPNTHGGSGFWTRYMADIQLAKELGVNAFRLSLEWHRIEPVHKKIDADAVKRYHEIFDAIEAAGMIPNVTLHHFVHPTWFQKMGAFEKEENIEHFISFSTFCAKEWGSRVKFWATFNEPTCMAFCGYMIGVHPPAHFFNFWLMGKARTHMQQC